MSAVVHPLAVIRLSDVIVDVRVVVRGGRVVLVHRAAHIERVELRALASLCAFSLTRLARRGPE